MKKGFYFIFIYIIITLSMIIYTASLESDKQLCQNIVSDKEYFKQYSKSPELKSINDDFELLNTSIGSCINFGNVLIILDYKTKNDMSLYNISYTFDLSLNYNKSGQIKVLLDYTNEINSSYIKEIVKERINLFENNKRVKEFIKTFNPTEGYLGITNNQDTRLNAENRFYTIWYSNLEDSVKGYVLPNSIKFNDFIEISMAHKIINENYLTENLTGCVLTGSSPGYTMTGHNYNEKGPWYLKVEVLDCKKGNWFKEITLRIQENNSYELINIYDPPVNEKRTSYIPDMCIIIIIIIVFIISFFIVYKRENKSKNIRKDKRDNYDPLKEKIYKYRLNPRFSS